MSSSSLVGAHDLELAESWVMPVVGHRRMSLLAFPPNAMGFARQWSRSTRLSGTVIEPGQVRDLIERIEWVGPDDGTFKGIEITYERDGETFSVGEPIRLTLVTGDCRSES